MKENIVENYKKRFHQICEMTVFNGVDEADNPNDNGGGDPNGGGMPPMGGGDPNGGGMPPMDGGDPNGGGMPPMDGGDPNGGGMPPMDGGDPNGGAQGPEGFDPQVGGDDPMGGGMPPMDGGDPNGGMGPDDEMVDITELTDGQKETDDKIDKLNDKFAEVMKHIGKFEELIRNNNEKISNLKSEFEKRNPTQIEKLGLQTTKSYPFSQTPDEFWKQKEATSNYSTEPDNNGIGQGQYAITKDDVNGAVDWKSISDSLDDDDFIYNQTLDGVLKI